eukprot:4230053-Amphidinium_carterae.3
MRNDAIGIWALDRAPKKNKGTYTYNDFTTKVIFAVDLLMLQEEYDVKIRQARSGNFLIAGIIPWSCICMIMNARGAQIIGWSSETTSGRLEAAMTEERLAEERRKKRARPSSDPSFEEKTANFDSDEMDGVKRCATGSASSAEAEAPSAEDEPERETTKGEGPYVVERAQSTKVRPGTISHIVPWDLSMAYTFSESDDVLAHMQSTFQRMPIGSAASHTMLYTTFRKGIRARAYGQERRTRRRTALPWQHHSISRRKGSSRNTVRHSQKRLYESLTGPVQITTVDNSMYEVPIVGIAGTIRGMNKPSMGSFDLAVIWRSI